MRVQIIVKQADALTRRLVDHNLVQLPGQDLPSPLNVLLLRGVGLLLAATKIRNYPKPWMEALGTIEEISSSNEARNSHRDKVSRWLEVLSFYLAAEQVGYHNYVDE